MENTNYNPLSKRQGQDTNFKANIQFTETVVITENIEPECIIIVANLIWIKDKNGKIRQTEQGTPCKVYIKNGQISFDKPLKFKNNG